MENVDNNLPVDSTELTSMMIDPDKDNIAVPVNRNNQLGNINHREVFLCQALEEHALVVGNIPGSLGGNIFRKWGNLARLKKHHLLTLSGSRHGFVRRMERTRINKDEQKSDSAGVFQRLFQSKSRKGDY